MLYRHDCLDILWYCQVGSSKLIYFDFSLSISLCTFKSIVYKMSANTSASLQHILISIEEYERLKNIEKQYQKLHEGIEEKLQIINLNLTLS